MNIRQIAYLAGVSVATVSRCINQPEKVSEETRNHIIGVMKRVDYIPNPSDQKPFNRLYKDHPMCNPDPLQ